MLRRIKGVLLYLSIFVTLIIIVCVYLNLVDRATNVYIYMIGFSGALWGIVIAFSFRRKNERYLEVWKILLQAISGYILLFLFYWAFIPDIVITGWGPIPDRMASWLIAGMVSICSLAVTGLVLVVSHLLHNHDYF